MRKWRQERLDDALAAAAVDETEAGGAGTADAAGGRDGARGARKRRRGEGEGEDDGGEGADDVVSGRGPEERRWLGYHPLTPRRAV